MNEMKPPLSRCPAASICLPSFLPFFLYVPVCRRGMKHFISARAENVEKEFSSVSLDPDRSEVLFLLVPRPRLPTTPSCLWVLYRLNKRQRGSTPEPTDPSSEKGGGYNCLCRTFIFTAIHPSINCERLHLSRQQRLDYPPLTCPPKKPLKRTSPFRRVFCRLEALCPISSARLVGTLLANRHCRSLCNKYEGCNILYTNVQITTTVLYPVPRNLKHCLR